MYDARHVLIVSARPGHAVFKLACQRQNETELSRRGYLAIACKARLNEHPGRLWYVFILGFPICRLGDLCSVSPSSLAGLNPKLLIEQTFFRKLLLQGGVSKINENFRLFLSSGWSVDFFSEVVRLVGVG